MVALDLLRSLTFLLAFACFSCAITKQQAIDIAAHEIAARHLPLPADTQVEVAQDRILVFDEAVGVGEEYPRYIVAYRFRGKLLYAVCIRSYTPHMREFKDLRQHPDASPADVFGWKER